MLLLICRPCYSDYFHGNIQIHLMLLLITDGGACPPNIILIQIHLMLLLIDTLRHVRQRVGIQIHLMLLLIMCGLRRIGATKKDSNTSHVTINHLSHYSNSTRQRNSNTSHVTINLAFILSQAGFSKNSNTSHVTINRQYPTYAGNLMSNSNTSHVTINLGYAPQISA